MAAVRRRRAERQEEIEGWIVVAAVAEVVWMNEKREDFGILWKGKGFDNLVGRSKEEEGEGGRKVEVKRKGIYEKTLRKPLKWKLKLSKLKD